MVVQADIRWPGYSYRLNRRYIINTKKLTKHSKDKKVRNVDNLNGRVIIDSDGYCQQMIRWIFLQPISSVIVITAK